MKLEAYNPELSSPPKPEYTKCNCGRELTLCYNPLIHKNVWDCVICYQKMVDADNIKPWGCISCGNDYYDMEKDLVCPKCGEALSPLE